MRRIETSPKVWSGLQLRREEEDFLAGEEENDDRFTRQGFNLHTFYSLCRGERPATSCPCPAPQCSLETNSQPYLVLAPLRLERLCQQPVLYMYHDLLTEGEMALMKKTVLSRLEASTVLDHRQAREGRSRVSNERTQSSGWLLDGDDELVLKISKKVSLVTGLETFRPQFRGGNEWLEAEIWQMGLYGAGGHYLPHYDSFPLDNLPPNVWNGDVWVGNRLASQYCSHL